MIAVKGASRRVARDPGKQFAAALDRHKQMEAELSRAFNRWQKSRLALHRLEKRLDKAQAEQFIHDTAHFAAPFNDSL